MSSPDWWYSQFWNRYERLQLAYFGDGKLSSKLVCAGCISCYDQLAIIIDGHLLGVCHDHSQRWE